MKPSTSHELIHRLDGLRDELIDLAFVLERRGNPEAADVAHLIRARMDELRGEFSATCPDRVGSFVE